MYGNVAIIMARSHCHAEGYWSGLMIYILQYRAIIVVNPCRHDTHTDSDLLTAFQH